MTGPNPQQLVFLAPSPMDFTVERPDLIPRERLDGDRMVIRVTATQLNNIGKSRPGRLPAMDAFTRNFIAIKVTKDFRL